MGRQTINKRILCKTVGWWKPENKSAREGHWEWAALQKAWLGGHPQNQGQQSCKQRKECGETRQVQAGDRAQRASVGGSL